MLRITVMPLISFLLFACLSQIRGRNLRSMHDQLVLKEKSKYYPHHARAIKERVQQSTGESFDSNNISRLLQVESSSQPTSSPSKNPVPNTSNSSSNDSAVAITYLVYFFILFGVGLLYYFIIFIGRICRFIKPGERVQRNCIRLCVYIGIMNSSEAVPATAQIVDGSEENKDDDSTAVIVEIMHYNSDYTLAGNGDSSTVPIVTAKRVVRSRPTEAVAVASVE